MLKTLRIELLKLKGLKLFLTATALPLFAVLQGRLFVTSLKGTERGMHPWEMLYTGGVSQFSSLILPIVITIIMAMLTRVEHANNVWKQLFALPVKRGNVYFSKLIIGILIAVYSTLVFCFGIIIAGMSLGIKDTVPLGMILQRPVLGLLASLPIAALQFYLSIKFSHIGIPLAFGAGLALPSMLVANSARYWIYYPWTYPIVVTLSETFSLGQRGSMVYIISIVSFVIIVCLGFIEFRKKDIV